MPGRTQNHSEMPQNLEVLRPKMPPCTKTAVFCTVIFFTLFLLLFFRHFWWISSPFGLPRSKRRWSVLGNFFVIFRFFLRFGLLLQFWSIFLAQGDQKCRKNDEKTSLTTNLFTSSYHQPTHDILFIFPVNGKLKRPFPMNGRAVIPALPAQSARPSGG